VDLSELPVELIDDLSLGSARGGARVGAPLAINVERVLTSADIPLLRNPPPLGTKPPSIKHISHQHHKIAQMLASGASKTEISLITGFSLSYLSILDDDPSIKELTEAYRTQDNEVRLDAMQRLTDLGLSAVEEMAKRMGDEEGKAKIPMGTLLDIAETALVKPNRGVGGGTGGGGAGGANAPQSAPLVQVTFVKSAHSGDDAIDVKAVGADVRPALTHKESK
jgi:hypothetical protein